MVRLPDGWREVVSHLAPLTATTEEESVRTIDVRLLVRSSMSVPDLLEQLLSGVARVHAVVELVPDPRVALRDGTVNPRRGQPIVSPPVHRHRHSEAHYAAVRQWSGDVLPGDDQRELAERFANQERTRAGAVDEVVAVLDGHPAEDREDVRP